MRANVTNSREVQAFILGQNDAHYKDIVQSVSGIIFLGTPHRGSNLAQVMNRVLQASVFNHSAKEYITELQRNSPTLQEINDQFRNIATDLSIVSFFETRPTTVGPRKMVCARFFMSATAPGRTPVVLKRCS